MSRLLSKLAVAALLACLSTSTSTAKPGNPKSSIPAPWARATPTDLSGLFGVVTGLDENRGTPTFIWAAPRPGPGGSVDFEVLARRALGRLAFLYGLGGEDMETLRLHRVWDPGRSAALVVFRQRAGDLPVLGSELGLLFNREGALIAASGGLFPGAMDAARRGAFAFTAEEALAEALGDRLEAYVHAGDLVQAGPSQAGFERYLLPGGVPGPWVLMRPARVRRVLWPRGSQLVAAYEAELLARREARGGPQAWRLLVSAADGQILLREPRTFSASYRVWAAPDGLHDPCDGPLEDVAPHPTGIPDGFRPEWTSPILVDLDGFNSNPLGDPDPWLAAEETRTFGNNARVYVDLASPDGYGTGDLWGTASGPGVFDYTYDASALPYASNEQRHAGAVQLFYTVNWLHDYFYDSGFDEAAGNAQQDNYGRGGLEGDPIFAQVEGKAEGFQNNASMSVLGDGESPFMMNGIWQASPVFMVDGERVRARGAFFGAPAYDVAGSLLLVQDGAAPYTDLCTAPAISLTDAVVLIERGTCTFASKALRAQGAGARAVIIANNRPGEGPQEMPNEDPPLAITIPVVSISYEDGEALKTKLQAGLVSVTLARDPETRQGALDSGVVAHEWGHYMHLRLVSGQNAQTYAMSEGFADFVAGFMVLREGDDLMGTYATGIYAIWHVANAAYYGIRRLPYSADLAKNALTFRHVSDGEPLPDTHPIETNTAPNSEVHNAGEIWGTVMHDLYIALLGETLGPSPRLTFPEARRRFADLLVLGMTMAPASPTFTEQRDALLAAAAAADPADMAILAQAFARRGLGTCAISPPRDSETFTGLTESFTLAPAMRVHSVTLDDLDTSCDDDGILDAGEVGRVVITLQNTGAVPLESATATVSSPSSDVSFPDGPSATFGIIAPYELATATVKVAASGGLSAPTNLEVEVTAENAEACVTAVAHQSAHRLHYDELAAASATDDVESVNSPWTAGGTNPGVWERREIGGPSDNHVWHADDLATFSDFWLASPPLEVSSSETFRLTFQHRHRFEQSEGTNWDGAVVELSRDDGDSWEDISDYADPGYGGVLTESSGNPLANREAFVGDSPSYPGWDTVSLDLGAALAGETVLVRFRIGTDQAAGEYGWDIDDIAFEGILNTPFPLVSENARSCDHPFADAGPDQTVAPGALVELDGTGSSDPQGDALSFLWTQVTGAMVSLEGADTATPSFAAPLGEDATALVFELTVSDGEHTDSDQVAITVDQATGGDGGVGPDGGGSHLTPGKGCGCQSGQPGGQTCALALLLLLGLLLGRRAAAPRRQVPGESPAPRQSAKTAAQAPRAPQSPGDGPERARP
ncbi:MAG: M36 family metallopeptidase [Polyangia bacterium]|jgi:hypothetical protein|nr:M36 family metallopeptidase [Polyangia bacterium]